MFILFSLYDNLLLNYYLSYHTYSWRSVLLNDLFLLGPFMVLFIFAVLERKKKHLNGKVPLVGVFILYALQTLFIIFGHSICNFSIFTSSFPERLFDFTVEILVVRVALLLLIPIANKNIFKIYSVVIISFLGISLLSLFTVEMFYSYHSLRSITEVTISIIIDILFHLALFFFSDIIDNKKKSSSYCYIPTILMDSNLWKLIEIEKKEYFNEATLKNIDAFEISGEHFLSHPPENALLHFDLKHQKEKTTVTGYFTHTFDKEETQHMLKKKNFLTQKLKDIEIDVSPATAISIESIERGLFKIHLNSKIFDTSENYEEVIKYMHKFIDQIIISQNIENQE